jgi:hypothetical protein
MSGGGSSRPVTQTTRTEQSPWSEQAPFLTKGFEQAEQNVLNRPLEHFPDPITTPFSSETEAALGGTAARAIGGSPLNVAAQNQLVSSMGGDYLNQGNPAFQAMTNRIAGDVNRQVGSQFASGGRYGSGLHSETAARGLADALAPVAFQNYEAERGRQLQAAQMAPGAAAQDYADLSALGGVGSARENLASEQMNEAIARHQFAQLEPQSRLGQYMGLVQGGYGTSGMATQTAAPRGGSGVGQALGLGLQGLGTGANLSRAYSLK